MWSRWLALPFLLVAFAAPAQAAPEASIVAKAARAITPARAPEPARETDEKAAPDSPRAALAAYLDLCREGRFAEAARYLELPRAQRAADAARTAQRLDAVLRRRLVLDLEDLSAAPEGASADGLPAGIDEIGRVPVHGVPRGEPVRLRHTDGDPRWVFTFQTVERTDKWYDALEDRWLRDRLPAWALRPGPRDLLVWQWIALPLFAALAWLVGVLLIRAVRPLFDRLAREDDLGRATPYREALRAPARSLVALGAFALAIPLLALDLSAAQFVRDVVRTLFELALFWIGVRAVDVGSRTALTTSWGRAHPTGAALMPLVGKIAKIALGVFALAAFLTELGVAVGSIVAGLGIGGLAFALAAQKTVENLFGGVSMGVDQPFRIGDYVTADGGLVSGTVEALGLRSTRIRTDARTVVTVPNGKLAEMRIENHGARDRYRLNAVLPLAPNTPADALGAIANDLLAHLRAQAGIRDDDCWAVVKDWKGSSVDLEVNAQFDLPDYAAFRALRHATLLRASELVATHGGAFAQVEPKV